jgi:hypothetical protein
MRSLIIDGARLLTARSGAKPIAGAAFVSKPLVDVRI